MSTNTKDIAKGDKPLKNKQHEQLCHEYLIDYNGHLAGIRAGYSKKTARTQVSELLTRLDISARLAYLTEKKKSRARKSADEIIERLENIAFTDLADILAYDKHGKITLVPSKDLDPRYAAALESISVGKDGRIKIKKAGAQKALELLGKEQGIFGDKLEVNGEVTVIRRTFNKPKADDKGA